MEKPKYYKYITSDLAKFTTNRIYQIIDVNNFEKTYNFIDDEGIANGCGGHNYKHFTPVTEHEWNLQEGIITKVDKEDYSYLIELFKKSNII